MRQFQLNFWNSFKKNCCYKTGLRYFSEKKCHPWKKYDRLVDIKISELKEIVKKENIKTIIIDMDGTLKYYKIGITDENKKWINEAKKFVDFYMISNANDELTSKVANEIGIKYICKAKKPSPNGFNKICRETNSKVNEVLVIGDAIRADVLGAQRYGIDKVILLKDLNILGLEHGKDEFEKFYKTSFYFIIFSFLGWIIEMIYHFAKGIFVNRGFLFGPFCVIYGFSALMILKFDEKLKTKNKVLRPIILWLITFFICSIFEYLTSYVTELILGIRLWDYSGLSFNIDGRVRLITSIAWSNCGLILIYLIKPYFEKVYSKILKNYYDKFHLLIHVTLWLITIDWLISFITKLGQ